MRMMDETSVIGSGYDDRLEHPLWHNDVGYKLLSYNKHSRQHVVVVRHNSIFALNLHTSTMADKSYIIVGAGVSGLYIAMMLDSLGIKYEILEGSGRIGGRLYTHYFPKNSGPYQYYVSLRPRRSD